MEGSPVKIEFKKLLVFLIAIAILAGGLYLAYINYRETLQRQTVEAEIARADRYLAAGEFRKAAEAYRKVLKLTGKEDPAILKKLVAAEIGLKNRDEAEKALLKLKEINPKDAETYFQLALIAYEKRETTEAIRLAKKAAALKATYLAPRYFLAKQYLALNDFDNALVAYSEILKINPKIASQEPQILKEIAYCYEKKGDRQQAIFYYQQALSYLPGDAEIFQALKRLTGGK